MRHSRRLLNPLLLPALIGAVLAAFAWVLAPDSRVYVLVSPAVLLATVGLLTSGCILITMRVRMRYQRRIQAGIVDTQIAADQARRRFVARLDHELKNPLTALLTVLSDPATDSAGRVQASVLGTARGQADRMRRLLTDLRRVADVETAALDIGPVDLAALLSDTVELVKADTRGARPIRLVVPAAPRPLPLVPGDADLLLVAIYNVLSNAMKYSRPGDAIEVRAREMPGPAGHIVIDIADSGPGIAPADIDVVWEELARGSSSAACPVAESDLPWFVSSSPGTVAAPFSTAAPTGAPQSPCACQSTTPAESADRDRPPVRGTETTACGTPSSDNFGTTPSHGL